MTALTDKARTRIPRWWGGAGGAAGAAFRVVTAPAEAGFRGIVWARALAYERRWIEPAHAPIAVVSVGNLAVGGAGKTPFAAWLAATLAAAGRRPAIVLRGYGADEIAVHRTLNPDIPVIAAVRRAQGVETAAREGQDIAVLDDAFQHRALARDLDIVLVAAESWSARRRLLPRGPWREPATALRRADLVVVTRKSASRARAAEVATACGDLAPGVPRAICHLRPGHVLDRGGVAGGMEWLEGRSVLAVASLADPEPFVDQLRAAGATVELAAYPDHHAFTVAELVRIEEEAGGRDVVCTLKEAVKLVPLAHESLPLHWLDQEVVVEEGAGAIEMALRGVVEP